MHNREAHRRCNELQDRTDPFRVLLASALVACCCATTLPARSPQESEKPWQRRQREMQDRAGGLPAGILKLQSRAKVAPPSIDEAIRVALAAAARTARPLLDTKFHTGRRLHVPGDHATIQAALDAARPRDVVVVAPGTYFELLTMKNDVMLVSDRAQKGDALVAIPRARTKLPRRTLRTVLDGSRSRPTHHGMIDFPPGASRHTIVDGFTIQNLPAQDHHVPGHAHGLNMRGASAIVTNCLLRDNGSTGIGNHVLYKDQGAKMATRDFRYANIAHRASAVIYRNIICNSLGRGIGCNHFASPLLLGNEVFANSDADHGDTNGPGIGAKHGATPTIIGNIVHGNPGGGISSRTGARQGKYPIDRPTSPVVKHNVVFGNGKERPGISNSGGGSKKNPVTFTGNFVFDAGAVGIGLVDGAVGVITDNVVAGTRRAGIAIVGSEVLRLDGNKVTKTGAPGFVIVKGASVRHMKGNAADATKGPRFLMHESTVGKPAPRKPPAKREPEASRRR